MIGSTIGSYRITRLLGEGGMGAVYRATDNIEREVAIKALHPQLTRDESRLQRFRSEAVALGRLHHPNIASLYHLLEQDGNFYMVMEFVEGQTLEDIVRKHGALPPRLALDIFINGLHGFEHAHARGVIHRDIKPSNLMVSSEGTTKITDFGIARMAGSGRLTQTGKLIGTLEYMSPEQVRGLEQDARSDIYSLGILLFELLTGRMPFTATSDFEIMRAHLEDAPPPARSFVASLPPLLDEIIAKALAKNADARFENVGAFRNALEAVVRELPVAPAATTLVSVPPPSPTPPTTFAQTPPEIAHPNSVGIPPVNMPSVGVPPQANPQVHSQPNTRSLKANKWLVPAFAGGGGLMLLVVGVLAMGSLRPSAKVETTPTPISNQLSVEPTPSPGNLENQASSSNPIENDVLPVVEPTPAPKVVPDIDIPETIPGFNAPPNSNPVKARNVVPDKPKTTTPVKTTPIKTNTIRTRERATVVSKPPTTRVRTRRVTASPSKRRNVERVKPKRRVVREVERRRPTKVVQRPVKRTQPAGGGERAALRALIKGN